MGVTREEVEGNQEEGKRKRRRRNRGREGCPENTAVSPSGS
jgi:hypothetical protein